MIIVNEMRSRKEAPATKQTADRRTKGFVNVGCGGKKVKRQQMSGRKLIS